MSLILFNVYSESILEELDKAGIFSAIYADDIICVVQNRNDAMRAIRLVETISEKLHLTLNKAKSGIVIVDHFSEGESRELLGVPIMKEYKYLGTWIDRSLSSKAHLEKANLKYQYVAKKLGIFRYKLDLKLNTHLFKLLILPSVRMLGCAYKFSSAKDK